ncbi:hypothetical protein DFH11DRAFT_1548256 [Phellopilus nigrolimitatus]|nr:hypothetical protein DFH11DRAFT_1548256 [Phellopilus nigrolimitatus]
MTTLRFIRTILWQETMGERDCILAPCTNSSPEASPLDTAKKGPADVLARAMRKKATLLFKKYAISPFSDLSLRQTAGAMTGVTSLIPASLGRCRGLAGGGGFLSSACDELELYLRAGSQDRNYFMFEMAIVQGTKDFGVVQPVTSRSSGPSFHSSFGLRPQFAKSQATVLLHCSGIWRARSTRRTLKHGARARAGRSSVAARRKIE